MNMCRIEIKENQLRQEVPDRAESAKVAIASLFEQHYEKIVRYIFAHVNDRTEAEDLGGDVFLKAFKSLKSYRGRPEQRLAWLFKIAHNHVIDYMRKKSKQKNVSLSRLDIPDHRSTEEIAETSMEFERLSQALERLTPSQREIVGLRFFAGLPSAEVSRITGKKDGTVREMQSSAIKVLRKLMCNPAVAGSPSGK
jgi:RNA polymerase sigma-70 factor (ECF subfamily)